MLSKNFFRQLVKLATIFRESSCPQEYSHLPILGVVRNPWEFYVSWYEHVRPRNSASVLFSWLSNKGQLDFIELRVTPLTSASTMKDWIFD